MSATYWDLVATLRHAPAGETFEAVLVSVDGRRIPAGRDFDPATGRLKDAGLPAAGRAAGRRVGRQAAAASLPRGRAGRQALHHAALSAFHHQHPAAGSQPQVRLHRPADDGGGPKPLRERAHHLHAHRLDDPGRGGHRDGAANDRRAVRPGVSARRGRGSIRPRSRMPRRPTKRSGRRAIPSTCPRPCATCSARTSSGSTT